jgi:hypothetical protein
MLSYTLTILNLSTVLSIKATQTILLNSVKLLFDIVNIYKLVTRLLSA